MGWMTQNQHKGAWCSPYMSKNHKRAKMDMLLWFLLIEYDMIHSWHFYAWYEMKGFFQNAWWWGFQVYPPRVGLRG